MVHASERQYSNDNGLREAILCKWDRVSLECILRHIASMPKRCCHLIKGDGDRIAY